MQRLSILHFAFEDHLNPSRGGQGIRSHEVNRRLARRHRVVVVTFRYRGARRRVEDGVEYRHLGVGSPLLGRRGSFIAYHLCVPIYAALHRADVVVEDFAPPMSSVSLPRFTKDPTVAVVQWLFADSLSKRYRMPFSRLERAGLASHDRFIAVSKYIARQIAQQNPGAEIEVAYAGVPDRLDESPPPEEDRHERVLAFLGRHEVAPKGLDLLLQAFAEVARSDPWSRLVIAGDGPDTGALRTMIDQLGLTGQVDLPGRVAGDEKRELLTRATAVVVPSRFESFGLVAIEALACGTPVVGFAIPSLCEIVDRECGILVPPFDTAALADAFRTVFDDHERRGAMRKAAWSSAGMYDWDEAAAVHERVYLRAAGFAAPPRERTGPDRHFPEKAYFRWTS